MSDPIAEYTVRDFSAVDEQVKQIAEREKVLTNKLRLANLRQALILCAIGLLAFGVFLLLAAWAYRIAFPPEQKIIETVKVVEKIVQPPKIIIQTPNGSLVSGASQTTENNTTTVGSELEGQVTSLSGQSAEAAAELSKQRLNAAGISASGESVAASLTWDNFNDLGLIVQEPNGELIWFKEKRSSSSGRLDIDANSSSNRTRSPIENISWPDTTAPKGTYKLYVLFYSKAQGEPSTGVTSYQVVLNHSDQRQVFKGNFPNNTVAPKRSLITSFRVE